MTFASSVIRSIDYDIDTKDLIVELQSGARYRYHNVPSKTHDDFVAAESVGRFFNTNIKGKFTVTKLSNLGGEDSMKITVDKKFLGELKDVLAVHIVTLRMQKQRIVSELALVSESLESAEALAGTVVQKLSTKPEPKTLPTGKGEGPATKAPAAAPTTEPARE